MNYLKIGKHFLHIFFFTFVFKQGENLKFIEFGIKNLKSLESLFMKLKRNNNFNENTFLLLLRLTNEKTKLYKMFML